MKLLFSLLASSLGLAAAQVPALESRWAMSNPAISYDGETDIFTIDYLGAGSTQIDMQEEFYDVNCKDDGSGYPEHVVRTMFEDPSSPGSRPKMTIGATTERPELKFKIDTQQLANDIKIYEIVGENNCLGQYYDTQVNIDGFSGEYVDNDGNVAYYPVSFKVIDTRDNSVAFDSGNVQTQISDSGFAQVINLCRGIDYDFEFTAEDDIANTFPEVTMTYNSSGTPTPIIAQNEFDMSSTDGVYTFTDSFSLPLNPQNPATDLQGQEGKGMMKFCVRGGIGYNKTAYNYDDASLSLADQIAAGYQEVNFIESLVTIFYDLTSGFSVDAFNVDPKERIETTAAKETYELEAWLCVTGNTPADMDTESWGSVSRVAPKEIANIGAYTNAPNVTPQFFNQGALITVCVAPKQTAWEDGIRMDGITYFDWVRNDLTSTAGGLADTSAINQDAIVGGVQSPNLLTSYTPTDCEGAKHFCRFSSILFADFFVSTGSVSGSGNAKLTFGANNARRLGESTPSRQLQADEGGESPFDLAVPVDITDTGPAGLKTAAGVSFAASTFTMAVALVGAALLA